jgi:hypothetical protein
MMTHHFFSSLTTIATLLTIPSSTHAGLTIGSVSSTSTCYSALHSSSNTDNLVNKTEYFTFINLLSSSSSNFSFIKYKYILCGFVDGRYTNE